MGREVLYRVREDNFAEIPLPAMEGGTCQECTYWQGTVTGDRSALRQQMFADGTLRGKLALDASGQGVGFLQYGRLVAYPEWDKLRRQFPIESTDEEVGRSRDPYGINVLLRLAP